MYLCDEPVATDDFERCLTYTKRWQMRSRIGHASWPEHFLLRPHSSPLKFRRPYRTRLYVYCNHFYDETYLGNSFQI